MIPWVTSKLVSNRVKIFSIESNDYSLEEIFLKETQNNDDDLKETQNDDDLKETQNDDDENRTSVTNIIYNIKDSVINRSNMGKESKKK